MLGALTHCVRAFSREQIAAEYFGNQPHKLDQLSDYVERGLLVNIAILVRQMPIPTEPLFAWSVGDAAPDFQKLVALVRNRWSSVPTRKTQVYLRGPVATKLLGGVAGNPLKRPLQASHDIGLSGVYLSNRRTRPEVAKYWFGEDLISGLYGRVVPDALYINEQSESELAIEFCGLYSASRYKKFHGACAERRLSYELW